MGLKGDKREAMHKLPLERKMYLLQQNRQYEANSSQGIATGILPHNVKPSISPVVPNSTGDSGIMRRFSFWGTSDTLKTELVPQDVPSDRSTSPVKLNAGTSIPQSAGSIWSGWWASSGLISNGKAAGLARDHTSALSYVHGIKEARPNDPRLVKHLISLRVHLSTAMVAWVEDFIFNEHGLDAFAALLSKIVYVGGRPRAAGFESAALLEIIKCMRVLLNTGAGFKAVVNSPTIIPHIAFSLKHFPPRTRTLACELLAAICIVSSDGHRAVMAAMSEVKLAFGETFRFETLIETLRLRPDEAVEDVESTDGSQWEVSTSCMALINAITNLPECLEDRVLLREEFGRRGLNELIVVSINPLS